MDRLDRALAAAPALLLVALGFLPIANWIPGGLSASWYGPVMGDLLTGGAIALGLGVVAAVLTRHRRVSRLIGLNRWIERSGPGTLAAIAVLAFGSPLVARGVFQSAPPHRRDCRFSGAHSDRRPPDNPAAASGFFSNFHVVEQGGRVYGQFPIGGPAMLALGTFWARSGW
jgi:hypothetical protein